MGGFSFIKQKHRWEQKQTILWQGHDDGKRSRNSGKRKGWVEKKRLLGWLNPVSFSYPPKRLRWSSLSSLVVVAGIEIPIESPLFSPPMPAIKIQEATEEGRHPPSFLLPLFPSPNSDPNKGNKGRKKAAFAATTFLYRRRLILTHSSSQSRHRRRKRGKSQFRQLPLSLSPSF